MNKYSNNYITDGKNVFFTKNCMHCGKDSEITITLTQYVSWVINNAHIQDVFPEMSNEDREVLISGTHPNCWKEMFADDDEFEEIDYSNFSDEELGFDNEEKESMRTCICCKREIDLLWKDIRPEATNLDNAADIEISGSYGSRYDLTVISGFICDDCIDQLVNEKIVTIKIERI